MNVRRVCIGDDVHISNTYKPYVSALQLIKWRFQWWQLLCGAAIKMDFVSGFLDMELYNDKNI